MTTSDGHSVPSSPTSPTSRTSPARPASSVGPDGPARSTRSDDGPTAGLLRDATHRLVRAVDGMDDAAYDGASGLPGWSRGHVVAHLALNAEALAGVLHAVAAGAERGEVAMYAGDEQRDADIDALGPAGPAVLRSRLYGAVTDLAEAIAGLPPDRHGVEVARTPGSERTFAAGEVATMRLHEVEIHHVDLALDYTPAHWPAEVAVPLVDRLAHRARATLVASDTGHTWQSGDAGPSTVTGTAAEIGWWLTGRGDGTTLTSDGDLPRIESW